ncbi:DUF6634 family protein [Cognatiyoonia sp. IB215182]|uniref:DUF6634 family protein n=1 Tax=Cognatiyoonia sp. IB215182 TaxID=3097353 RepID=UPI002A167C49|nr:DUF6634 family protein [Cognatiyoonia sp. IB215182]MDX8350776.1 DUF6634 family protein [Cognatiyoonia sp. IB215182]
MSTHNNPPSDAELSKAPVLEDWSLIKVGGRQYRLSGFVRRAPAEIPETVVTSAAAEINFREGWVRTANTLYRLSF